MADASALREKVRTRAARAQILASVDMKTAYRRAAPYASGDTQESIDIINVVAGGDRLTCTAVATTPQAKWTDEGTKPHTIRPRTKKALRFRYKGRIVFAKVVNHPGNDGTGWFSKLGKREWGPTLQRAFGRLG